jgi:hypothetical protein
MLNNLERIFTRAKRRNRLSGTLDEYKTQTRSATYILPASGSIIGQPVDFAAGAIIISIGLEATMRAQAASAPRGSLDMIRIGMDLPSQDGTLVSGGPVRASCLCGRDGSRQWPEREIVMPKQGSISVSLTNLTTSDLDVDVSFNILIPRGAG